MYFSKVCFAKFTGILHLLSFVNLFLPRSLCHQSPPMHTCKCSPSWDDVFWSFVSTLHCGALGRNLKHPFNYRLILGVPLGFSPNNRHLEYWVNVRKAGQDFNWYWTLKDNLNIYDEYCLNYLFLCFTMADCLRWRYPQLVFPGAPQFPFTTGETAARPTQQVFLDQKMGGAVAIFVTLFFKDILLDPGIFRPKRWAGLWFFWLQVF